MKYLYYVGVALPFLLLLVWFRVDSGSWMPIGFVLGVYIVLYIYLYSCYKVFK